MPIAGLLHNSIAILEVIIIKFCVDLINESFSSSIFRSYETYRFVEILDRTHRAIVAVSDSSFVLELDWRKLGCQRK